MSELGGHRPPPDDDDDIDMADLGEILPPLDAAPGPALRLPSARLVAMVSSAVDAAWMPTAASSATPPARAPSVAPFSPFDVTRPVVLEPQETPRRRWAQRSGVLATALILASVGTAAAGVWMALRGDAPVVGVPAASGPADPSEPVGHPAAARLPEQPLEPADRPVEVPAPPGEVDSVDPPDPVEDATAERPERRERAPRGRVRAPRRLALDEGGEDPASAPEPARTREVAPVPTGPMGGINAPSLPANAPVEDIVSMANLRRKERRWRAAEELYERVMRDHPGTDAAAIATVASASLHLDALGDPPGALERFRKALRLRPDGPLAEEARWGLAEAHRALRDAAAERDALRAFLAAHPRSVNAARARARLAELGVGP